MTGPPFFKIEEDPDWRANNKREWAHDLPSGIAAALGLFDPPESLNEALLARVLRDIATRSDEIGDALFLRALADACDNTLAERRLTLGRLRRGRPQSSLKVDQALSIGTLVEQLVGQGWKKEAAVHEAMSAKKLSRSAVLRACAEYKKLRPIIDSIQLAADSVRKSRSAK